MQHLSHSQEETIKIGYQLGRQLSKGSVVCLYGDLAAGKTTFVKGLAEGAVGVERENVNSPTFVYLNIYKDVVYHFDLYRLKGPEEFVQMGLDEYLFSDGICCIEWSERIESLLPPDCIKVTISHVGENKRQISL